MDEAFLKRVYRTSWILAALVTLFGATYGGVRWGVAFGLAGAWSIINLRVLEYLLILYLKRRGRLRLIIVFLLKILGLYGLLLGGLFVIRLHDGRMPIAPWFRSALLCGISLPYAVIVLKALGRVLVPWTSGARMLRESETQESRKAR
jgi:hypothetical protein